MNRVVDRLADHLHYTVNIGQDGVVPEAENLIAAMLQESRTLRVLGFGLTVLAAIGFNDHAGFARSEIGDVGTNWHLPPKLHAEEVAIA